MVVRFVLKGQGDSGGKRGYMKIYTYIFDRLTITLEIIQIANVPRVHTIHSMSLHKSNNSKIIMAAAGARPLPAVGVRKAALDRYLLAVSARAHYGLVLKISFIKSLSRNFKCLLFHLNARILSAKNSGSIRGNP